VSKIVGPLSHLNGVPAEGCDFYSIEPDTPNVIGWQNPILAEEAMRLPFSRRAFAGLFVGTLILPWSVIAYGVYTSSLFQN